MARYSLLSFSFIVAHFYFKMPAKRSSSELCLELDDAIGPVSWLRVTSTNDAKNKRRNYCINLHSGSSTDEPPTRVEILGRTQISLSISDSEISKWGSDEPSFLKERIFATVRKSAGELNFTSLLSI